MIYAVRPELAIYVMDHTKRVGTCMEWTGFRWPTGYGAFRDRAEDGIHERYAHRAVYAMTFGPIPEGLCICHRCDNPPCVNPSHLFLGTYRDNVRDSMAKGRRPNVGVESRVCLHCGSAFEVAGYSQRLTCSEPCRRARHSIFMVGNSFRHGKSRVIEHAS